MGLSFDSGFMEFSSGKSASERKKRALAMIAQQEQQKKADQAYADATGRLGYMDIGQDMLNQYMGEFGLNDVGSKFQMSYPYQLMNSEAMDEARQAAANLGYSNSGAAVNDLANIRAANVGSAYRDYIGGLTNLMNMGTQTTGMLNDLTMQKAGFDIGGIQNKYNAAINYEDYKGNKTADMFGNAMKVASIAAPFLMGPAGAVAGAAAGANSLLTNASNPRLMSDAMRFDIDAWRKSLSTPSFSLSDISGL